MYCHNKHIQLWFFLGEAETKTTNSDFSSFYKCCYNRKIQVQLFFLGEALNFLNAPRILFTQPLRHLHNLPKQG